MPEPRKRIFIGLIVFTVVLITAVTVGLYLIPYIGLKNIHPLAPRVVCATLGLVIGALILGVALLIVTLAPAAVLLWRHRPRRPPGHCGQCGYDLTGNVSGRCPECGSPIQR